MSDLLEVGNWYRQGVDELYIPGPIDVRPEVLAIMSTPPYGHRVPEDMNPYVESIRENLFALVNAREDTHSLVLTGGSGTSALEIAARSWGKASTGEGLGNESPRVFVPSIGLFGDLWIDIFKRCNVAVDSIRSDDGGTVDLDELDYHLENGEYDIVAVTHNDTSTGTVNPIEEIAEIVKHSPTKPPLFFVDGVSSVGGMEIDVRRWGIDFLALAPQKGIGGIAGLAAGVVRNEALMRVVDSNRGYTTDVIQQIEASNDNMTLTTPPEAQIGALALQLSFIVGIEGVQNRYDRHAAMGDMVRAWGDDEGFVLLPAPESTSNTLTCFVNSREIDLITLQTDLRSNQPIRYGFDAGHPKLGKIRREAGLPDTFRIAHMGDRNPARLEQYLGTLSAYMARS